MSTGPPISDAAVDARGFDRVHRKLRREVEEVRAHARDPRDAFRGFFIDDREVTRLLEEGDGMTTRVQNRAAKLAQVFGLSPTETEALLAAAAPDLDLHYERIYGYLQDDVTRKRPTVELLLRVLSEVGEDPLSARQLLAASAPLLRRALIRLETTGSTALLARTPVVDERIVRYLLGDEEVDEGLQPFASLHAPAGGPYHDWISRIAATWTATLSPLLLVLEGLPGSGKSEAARSLAGAIGSNVLEAYCDRMLRSPLGAEAIRLVFREAALQGSLTYWSRASLLWEDNASAIPFREALLAEVGEWKAPVVLAGPPGWLAPAVLPGIRLVRKVFDLPSASTRRQSWRSAAERLQVDIGIGEPLEALASAFRLTGGAISDATAFAEDLALARGTPVQVSDLFAGARKMSSQALAGLAQSIEPAGDWKDIVLPGDAMAQLRELAQTVRLRGIVLEQWGLAERLPYGRGVTALFAGPSGTGKTHAARIVAARLGLPLYRIELAAVMSKWLGDMEKNLDRIFQAAEDSNGVLLFDEAEALFGKRAEVRDARDRYANVEVSYLLQKMELYDGVAILATNMAHQMDDAFRRRLSFTVHFPLPEYEDRIRIWETIWPRKLLKADGVDFRKLAQERLAGGNIRNIVLAAAYLAAADGGRVSAAHLRHAMRREYQKLGKDVDEATLAL